MANVLPYLVIVLVLAFVGWPLFRTSTAENDSGPESLSPLERQKLDAYAAIKEAEFDLRLGKLSPDDFTALTARYRQQALAAIASLEKARQRESAEFTSAGDAHRSSVRAADGGMRRFGRQEPTKGKRPGRFAYCPACGRPLPGKANFCGNCGHALSEAVA